MRKWLKNWLFKEEIEQNRAREEKIYSTTIAQPEEAVAKTQPKVRIGQVEAINGRLLEVSTYQRNPHGPDWKTEYYIIDPEQPLHEQMATVLTMKGLGV